MSLIVADLARVVRLFCRFEYAGVHLNRFTYYADVASLDTDNLLAFILAFDATVLSAVSQLQVSAHVWTTHTAQVLGGNFAQAELFVPRGGVVPGEGNGANVVYSFRFLRPAYGIRGGQKRFSGVPESYTSFGSYVPSKPPTADVNAVISALTTNVSAGGVTYTPVVLVETANGQPLPVPKYYIPLGAVLAVKPGTQNTRKG